MHKMPFVQVCETVLVLAYTFAFQDHTDADEVAHDGTAVEERARRPVRRLLARMRESMHV